ncbi:MAG: serine/threonine protein phosphatase [Ruminococcaceae bacterium]|nr:serine/threonine protein phosphatase [Oscillospiraceae bacterium]
MALFAVGDLHLSLGADKPMDIFGGWKDYVSRIENNWRRIVSDKDTVVICGDVSWAMKLENTAEDFRFIDSLPGRKIILKGNHDYWWNTAKKMNAYLADGGFSTLNILHNNFYTYGDYAICGSRGWSYDCPQSEKTILLRECGRLRMSLDSAAQSGLEPLVFLHYPPVYGDYRCDEIMDVLHEYNIKLCCYGHLHGPSHTRALTGDVEGINMKLVACDYTGFMPVLISG